MFKEPLLIPCTVEELNHVLEKWIRDGVVRPFTMSRPPTEEERKNPLFCRIHNYVKHSTKDCWTFRRIFHKKLREGTLELTKKEPEVQRNPLPNVGAFFGRIGLPPAVMGWAASCDDRP